MDGFHGRYLRVDLATGAAESIAIPESILERVLGGVGLGAWLLAREAPIGVDPLAPAAPLVFAFSPLVGTGLTTSAKFAVVAKSPLTGGISDALASSHFALAGKAMGIDALVFVGRCGQPSDWVVDALRPSTSWGRSAEEAAASLAQEGSVAAIGPAGEALVRFATISADGRHAGRGGLGAVMGSKRLKAIVVRGDHETRVADPERLAQQAAHLKTRAAQVGTAKYREVGTIGNLLAFDRLGVLPTRNFQTSHFDAAPALAGERWHQDRTHRRAACAHCTIGCEHRFARRIVSEAGEESRPIRVEYESLFALGPLCGVEDPDAVLAASERCDALGLDTISAGGTLAFAMECGERGELNDGPRFGESLLPWLDRIARREGLGDRLAEGSKRLAEAIGGDAIDRAPQVKGLELPGYEPRSLQTMALGLAVGTRGADHNRSSAYEADFSGEVDRFAGDARTVRAAVAAEERAAILDALILCKFVRGAIDDLHAEGAALLESVAGPAFGDPDALRAVGRRIVDLRKAYNIREGWQPEDDRLPRRFLEEPLPSGPARGARLPAERLATLIEGYNLERAWDPAGWLPESRWRALESELDLVLQAAGSKGEAG